ncbi:hypothetical protein ACLB2K_051465 [Fragaria x ananassa]
MMELKEASQLALSQDGSSTKSLAELDSSKFILTQSPKPVFFFHNGDGKVSSEDGERNHLLVLELSPSSTPPTLLPPPPPPNPRCITLPACEGCLWFRRSWVTPWRVFKLMGHCLWLEEIIEDAQPLRWKLCKSFKSDSAQMLDVQFGGSSSILKMVSIFSFVVIVLRKFGCGKWEPRIQMAVSKTLSYLIPWNWRTGSFSLIYESGPKARLLRYAAGALHFAEKGVDPFLVSWNRIVLLHGTPGTGKTSLCKALAQMLSIRFNSRSM